ncbi:MAG: NUDIX domain-containing protein [Pseudomonadota bacterium]
MPKTIRARILNRLFHLRWLITRPMTLGARAAAFDEAGRVFLVRHTYVPGWHLPGGGVERGETVWQAMEKELSEEGNIRLSGPARFFGMYKNLHASKRDHVALFVCRSIEQTAPMQPNFEIAETGFFAVDTLPQETTPATRRRLAEIMLDNQPDPFW